MKFMNEKAEKIIVLLVLVTVTSSITTKCSQICNFFLAEMADRFLI